MKHSKYIAVIAINSLFITSFSPSAFAVAELSNNFLQDAVGAANSSIESSTNSDGNESVENSDFVVKTSEVKKSNFNVNNADTVSIDGNLYIYGDLTIDNSDITVSGKLKVTGNLILNNGDLKNNGGRIYIGGKKKISNGGSTGDGAKVTADFAKYDPILRADLDKDEEAKVSELISIMRKDVETLKKELKATLEKNERIEPIKEKIRHVKEVFFTEMKQYIQEEDMAKFEKIQKEDGVSTESFLVTFKRKGEPSENLRKQIAVIVGKIAVEKRATKLTALVAKLDNMLTLKLSDKKKLLISQVKEVLQDELDGLANDDTIGSLLDDTPTSTASTTSGSGTTQSSSGSGSTTSTTTTVSGTGVTTTSSGSTTTTTSSGTTITQ